MKPERSSLRGLLARAGGVLLGALVLYAAGAGPAKYYETRYANTRGQQGSTKVHIVMWKAYQPLKAGVEGTALQGSLADYCQWWSERAATRYPLPPPLPFGLPPGLDFHNHPGICYERADR